MRLQNQYCKGDVVIATDQFLGITTVVVDWGGLEEKITES